MCLGYSFLFHTMGLSKNKTKQNPPSFCPSLALFLCGHWFSLYPALETRWMWLAPTIFISSQCLGSLMYFTSRTTLCYSFTGTMRELKCQVSHTVFADSISFFLSAAPTCCFHYNSPLCPCHYHSKKAHQPRLG